MTTIKLKSGSGAPLAGDLVAGEPALDLTNKRLYTEDSGGTVIEIGTSPSTIDINAGTIDGTVIGGSSAAAGTFTNLTATGTSTITTADINGGNIDGTVVGASAAAAGTFTTFTSTGIDDNATSTAITIDASENVGIGTASPLGKLDIRTSGSGTPLFLSNGVVSAEITSTTTDYTFGTGTLTPLAFKTNNSERMRIDSSGNVGIGTSSPSAVFHIQRSSPTTYFWGNASDAIRPLTITSSTTSNNGDTHTFNATSSSGVIAFATYNTERMRIDSSGNLLVGTTTGSGGDRITCSVTSGVKNGYASIATTTAGGTSLVNRNSSNVYVGGVSFSNTATSFPTSSDIRLKENIVDAPAGNIDAIRVRSFDWKADGSHQTYGMVAQELVDVAPEAVTQGQTEDDIWGVDYSKLVPMMIKEIQDLKAEVAAQRAELSALKGA